MRKLLRSLTIGISAVAMAPAANAAATIVITGPSGNFRDDNTGAGTGAVTLIGTGPTTGTGPVGAAGTFERIFNFITPSGFDLTGGSISTNAVSAMTNIDFSSVTLNGFAFTLIGTGTTFEFGTLALQSLIPGANNVLRVAGETGGDAAFSGNLAFTSVSAVPEPATWAFMLVGFGAVGYSMRKRPSYRLVQAV